MNNWKKLSIILLWLGIWQITATFIHNPIMLVGPIEALQTLWGLLPSGDFWISVYQSFLRISIGFLTAFMIGLLLGSLAYHIPFVKELLEPPMLFFKSVPVASFVILALIWAGSRNLSIFIAFIVVLPVILCQYHLRTGKHRSKASGNGSDIPASTLEKSSFHLSAGTGSLPSQRLPHCAGHELEIRCCR